MHRCLPLIMVTLITLPALAQDKMSRDDKAALLFSNRFSFTEQGEPVLAVGLMDQQQRIDITAKAGLRVLPSGPGGPEITLAKGDRWFVETTETKAGEMAYRAVLATLPTKDFNGIKKAAASWELQGYKSVRLELGSIFSFQGTVFDSRETLLCTPTLFATRDQARDFLESLPGGRTDEQRIVQVLAKRPTGTIVLKDPQGTVAITARDAIWFAPISGSLEVKDVEFARGYSWHGRQTRSYAGSFYVAVDKTGQLAIANVLPAETMLKGLVPAEIYPDSPDAALQAQAISARNELFSKIGHRHLADPYLICSEQDCQVYKGVGAHKKRSNRAVAETRGQVLFDENGKLADIRYHSTCGGHTEDGHEAWAGVKSPNLRGRFDTAEGPRTAVTESSVNEFLANPPTTWCGRSSRSRSTFRWEKSLTIAQLDELVAKQYNIGTVTAITVLHRGVSGRVNKLELVGAKGRATVHGELVIRRLFGGLKSSLFQVSLKDSQWVFTGGGFGHGVGMCQIGAMEMAKDGKTAMEILDFYYKSVTVKRIY